MSSSTLYEYEANRKFLAQNHFLSGKPSIHHPWGPLPYLDRIPGAPCAAVMAGHHYFKHAVRIVEWTALCTGITLTLWWLMGAFASRISRLADRAAAAGVLALTAYWFAYALAGPVTTWDSNVYNLGRLLVARQGGLFGNPAWNDHRQIWFPWSFDAIHYPFVLLGAGFAVPSFLCFAGLLLIIHRLVSARYGTAAGWWCCLCLFALPTVVYQATSITLLSLS